MKRKLVVLVLVILFSGCSSSTNTFHGAKAIAQYSNRAIAIEFADIPGNGDDVKSVKMGKTEITNQQYVDFLNAALREKKITVGKIEPTTAKGKLRTFNMKNQQIVYDKNGNRMINLLSGRTTADHNRNKVVELWEMANPLVRLMIEYDNEKKSFQVADPKKINWEIYFDNKHLPEGIKTVDSITNWAELHEFWPKGVSYEGRKIVTWVKGDYDKDVLFAGHFDLDFKLPTLEEVKKWPVTYIEYYAAKAFVDFYGLDLPTLQELIWAASSGKGYRYGTADGTISIHNVVYSGYPTDAFPTSPTGRFGFDFSKWPGLGKGHVQAVASFAPNLFGVYDLSGNVIEWTKTKNNSKLKCQQRGLLFPGTESFVTIGGAWNYFDTDSRVTLENCKEVNVAVGTNHFGFRVVKRTN